MNLFLYKVLIVWRVYSQILLPTYQVGSKSFVIMPSGSLKYTFIFAQPFANIPQGLVTWQHIDQDPGPRQYYFLIESITTNQLTLLVSSTRNIFSITLSWIAFLDDNIFTQYAEITQDINSQSVNIPIHILNSIAYIPNAAFFLNGIKLAITALQYGTAYNFEINSLSEVIIELQVSTSPGYKISWFSYTVIYGKPQHLIAGEQSFDNVGLINLFTPDGRTKFSKVGVIALEAVNITRITISNTNGSVQIQQIGDTFISYFRLSYIQYLPCPLYCTSCYVAGLNCDGCLLSTQRSGTTCTTCPSQKFSQADQMNCQQCKSYCNICVTAAINCIACQSATFRSGAPNCTTCPPGMFLELLIDSCQSCKAYCNGCSGSPTQCILCDINSLRMNPPDCLTCPPQYHVISNKLMCQPCLSYCNNCLANNSYCVACSSASQRLNPPDCLECPQFAHLSGETCIQCEYACDTCDQNGCLTCLNSSSYINRQNQCVDCPTHCLSCDIDKCNSCAGNCSQCDFNGCQKCIHDNYYLQGTDCFQCHLNCSTCNQSSCLTCIGPRTVRDNICQCQYPCLTCNSTECQTCISPDYRVYQGNCQYCPSRCVTCDQSGQCMPSPLNCQIGTMVEMFIICQQCEQNYYVNDNICNKCSSICLECLYQPSNCRICRFPQLNEQQCLSCESQIGYYSNFQTNICYTICGDAILAGNEQCDDGNSISQDGCTNCIIDHGYQCTGIVCYSIVYPIPTLYQDLTLDSPYNSTKLFLLTYNVALQATNFGINLLLKPSINLTYQFLVIDNQHMQFYINLQQQSINSILELTFLDQNSILSFDGIRQQIQFLKSDISDYLPISNTEQEISDSTNQITNVILIILIILFCWAILFGGLEVIWNLLDMLQTISYLKYINTVKPYYLYEFFNLFGFLQFQNLPLYQYFNTQNLVQNLIDINYFDPPPLLILRDGYTTSTILNIGPIINILFTGIVICYFAQAIERIMKNLNISRLIVLINKLKISIFLYDLNFYIMTTCDRISKQWKWSGLIRIFMTSANEICFMVCLGVYGLQIGKSNIVVRMDFIITLLTIISYITITYLISNIAGFQKNTILYLEDKYGAVFENLRLNASTKYYNTILIHKKLLFMIFLVLLYNEPVFQIICIILVQITQLIVILSSRPIQDKYERYKQSICEILMLFAEIALAILVIDDQISLFQYESRRIYGWICLFAIVLILITQLSIDGYQSYKLMYKKYKCVRKVAKCISFTKSNYHHGKTIKNRTIG